jgi:hypothetical protein
MNKLRKAGILKSVLPGRLNFDGKREIAGL